MFKVQFTPRGLKDLKTLPRNIQERVVKKLTFFSSQANLLLFATPLVHLPPTTHRFRVGDYRIAFFVQGKTIYVDRIKHRKDVYLH